MHLKTRDSANQISPTKKKSVLHKW